MNEKPILILNGPNLNLLGRREVEIYGNQTFESYFHELCIRHPNLDLQYFQSNHEGLIIDKLQEYGFNKTRGIILNAAAYSHTSIAIADTVKAIDTQVIELHISDIYKRESFRKNSYLTAVCKDHVIGKGLEGYQIAVQKIMEW